MPRSVRSIPSFKSFRFLPPLTSSPSTSCVVDAGFLNASHYTQFPLLISSCFSFSTLPFLSSRPFLLFSFSSVSFLSSLSFLCFPPHSPYSLSFSPLLSLSLFLSSSLSLLSLSLTYRTTKIVAPLPSKP
jgi:hypothetical protein